MFNRLEGDRQLFGVTLIERGSEVGGGDARFATGTLARVLMRRELEDGRLAVVAGGTNRLRVLEWHDDHPYPMATVEEMPDIEDAETSDVDAVVPLVKRLNSIATEVGSVSRPIEPDIQGGPAVRLYHLIDSTALGVLDRQRLLEAQSVSVRLDVFHRLLGDLEKILLMNIAPLDG
jgi:Lon protease-like protein